jgi:hypothetical protein
MSKRKNEESEIVIYSSPVKQQCVANDVRETEKILRELSLLFPEEKFLKRVPRVVMKHMIYSRISNRTVVDKEIVKLFNIKFSKVLLILITVVYLFYRMS